MGGDDRRVTVSYHVGKAVTLHHWTLRTTSDGAMLLKQNGGLAKMLRGDVLDSFLAGQPITHGAGRTLQLKDGR